MEVMMFHSIGNEKSDWYRNWLSCSVIHFENFCRFLVSNHYRTIFLDEWYDRSESTCKKCVVLTFDDGYADNWVYLYPLLQKYHMKATIFINPEFVDPSNELRPNTTDVLNGKYNQSDLEPLGFLNWPEIIEMQHGGLIDIQSHSMTHNFNFKSDRLIDLYTGQAKYDWIDWNLHPESKPFYVTRNHTSIPSGYPVFEFDRALRIRKYLPDETFVGFCTEKSGECFPDHSVLSDVLKKYPGRYETDQEMEERYWYELKKSKEILEMKLKKPVDFLCWPGGGYNNVSIALSVKAGYKASTISTRDKNSSDMPGYKRVRRFGMSSVVMAQSRKFFIHHPDHLIHIFKSRTGNPLYRNMLRLKKLFYRMKTKISR